MDKLIIEARMTEEEFARLRRLVQAGLDELGTHPLGDPQTRQWVRVSLDDAWPDEIEVMLETRRGKASDGTEGFLVSVVGGPQDLLWRKTKEVAPQDGKVYVRQHWRFTKERGWFAV